jgi:hypothetical protein
MNWLTPTAILAAAFTMTAIGAFACTDDKLSIEEYFQKTDAIDNDSTARIDAVFEGVGETEDVGAMRDAFRQFPPILDDAVSDLEDLSPPNEAETQHERVIETLKNVASTARDSFDELDAAQTFDDVFAVVEGDAFTQANEAFTAACLDLQSVAADNGIAVDLGCTDSEEGSSQTEERPSGEVGGAAVPADNRCHPTGC